MSKKTIFFFCLSFTMIAGFLECYMSGQEEFSPENLSDIKIFSNQNNNFISEQEFLKIIFEKNIVYVLEKHNDPVHHLIQGEIGSLLAENSVNFAVGFEMFNKNGNEQEYLNLYRSGKISEAYFIKQAWHWGFDFNLYKPVLDLVGVSHYQGVALNIPMPLTQRISGVIVQNGFDVLPQEFKNFFPDDGFKIICDEDGEYHAAIMRGLDAMRRRGIVTPEIEKKFHTSQWVMNEVMAAGILDYFKDKNLKESKMMVVVGSLHGVYRGGIISSVENRRPDLKQAVILIISQDDLGDNNDLLSNELADFILVLP